MNNTINQSIKFSKFHGAGNDFIMINAIESEILLNEELIYNMCDRRIGIGADGLIILLDGVTTDEAIKDAILNELGVAILTEDGRILLKG